MVATLQTKQQPKILDRLDGTTNKAKRNKEEKRIDKLVKLDERRRIAKSNRDREALLEIAAEYMLLNAKNGGCPDTSAQVEADAARL